MAINALVKLVLSEKGVSCIFLFLNVGMFDIRVCIERKIGRCICFMGEWVCEGFCDAGCRRGNHRHNEIP